jgi:hypothetical protein
MQRPVEAAQAHLERRRQEWTWADKAEETFLRDPTEANFSAALQGLRLRLWTDQDFEAADAVSLHTSETPQKAQDALVSGLPLREPLP